jgi:hypothetical protein
MHDTAVLDTDPLQGAAASWMSATTNWLPFTEPGLPFPMPEPNAIEHAEPGGVTCTTRKLSPAR